MFCALDALAHSSSGGPFAVASVGGFSRLRFWLHSCREEALAAGLRDQADAQIKDRSAELAVNVKKLRKYLKKMEVLRDELRAA